MVDSKPVGLEKPSDGKTPVDEPVIHVIPEKFFGAGLKIKAPPLPAAPGAPVAVPVPGAPGAPQPPKKGAPRLAIFIALAIFLLAALGGGAWFFLRPKPAPAPVVNEPVVVAPRCGDNMCEAPSETSANCQADCGAPAPVCGDDKCEAPSETFASCPDDCTPPGPTCGDNKCESPESLDSCPNDCTPPSPKPGEDNDSDGLSDQEEREVFGTDPNSPNTDRDSFVDLNEALNLFDPALPSPAMLRDSKKMAVYSNAASGYSMIRPILWTAKETADQPVMFNAPSGEFVSVVVVEKSVGQGMMDWYLAQAPGITSSQVEPYKTRQGYDAILSPDRQTAYVDLGNRVAVVSYNLASQPNVQYRVTFQVMVQSLIKK